MRDTASVYEYSYSQIIVVEFLTQMARQNPQFATGSPRASGQQVGWCYDVGMRTTVTLEPDVHALIRTAMKERGVSFKEALNAAVRTGLTQGRPKRRYFVQKSYSLGSDQNFRWDKALEAAVALEDEELGQKIYLRK